jgi:hypothetical protein
MYCIVNNILQYIELYCNILQYIVYCAWCTQYTVYTLIIRYNLRTTGTIVLSTKQPNKDIVQYKMQNFR